MCEWGTDVLLDVTIPAHLSHTGVAYRKTVGIDACIAPIVKALNDAGIVTSGSCCGHGRTNGRIEVAADQKAHAALRGRVKGLMEAWSTASHPILKGVARELAYLISEKGTKP